MTHTFEFEPATILGVSSTASLREIRDAYHQKSLKHHPDKGGDEWAFRMVTRAYEILSKARVIDRANDLGPRVPSPHTPPLRPEPDRRGAWSHGFGFGQANERRSQPRTPPPTPPPSSGPTIDAESIVPNLSGWGGNRKVRSGEKPEVTAKVVAAELLILRYELECSIDIFARSPEDRNLSCSVHLTWPIESLPVSPETLPGAADTIKKLGEAIKVKGVRKHAINARSEVENGRFNAWLTYPTAVMASEALDAFRAAVAQDGLEVEKLVREMAIPRQWK